MTCVLTEAWQVNGNRMPLPRTGWELGPQMFIWEYCLAQSTCLGLLSRNTVRAETAKQSVADRSWKELALALSLAIHYAWGMLSYF